MQNINRRESLKSLALITGISFSIGSAAAFLGGCKNEAPLNNSKSTLNEDQLKMLELITERILPKTDSPGANDAEVHIYIDQALSNFYTGDKKKEFIDGLAKIEQISREKYKKGFNSLDSESIDDILTILVKEWKEDQNKPHIFKELRDLTLTGFASSEIGATQFFVYDPIPGPYKGCIPYAEVNGTYSL